MLEQRKSGVIHTIKQNCRRCYTCVRDCPAKAIRIVDGQASVVEERCIACGNCTAVCSQGAKAYVSGVERVIELLSDGGPVAAMLAPSFPADFPDASAESLVGTLRQLGFSHVVEVAHGADAVSRAYRGWLRENPDGVRITTTCPAVVEYIRKYKPELTQCLIPIVSPMVATAKEVKRRYGDKVRCVFIGPCVAKKLEIRNPEVAGIVEEVLTFQELRRLMLVKSVPLGWAPPSRFDPPEGGGGRVYPLVGGLLRSSGIKRDPLQPEVTVLSGQSETIEVLSNLTRDEGPRLLVEALMCRGCYSGPGMYLHHRRLQRKQRISDYVTSKRTVLPTDGTPEQEDEDLASLHREFSPDDQRLKEPNESEIKQILARTNKFSQEDELNCGACGYPTCRAKAVAVYRGLAEEAMCLPFMVEQAERVCHELKIPWGELRDVHRHLINTEKLASMGQMAAGVAHELNNPLSTILLYSNILRRRLQARSEFDHDLRLLEDEAQRCKKIIGNLLDFARQNRVKLESTLVEPLLRQAADESLYAAQDGEDHRVNVVVDCPPDLRAEMDRDQIAQVLGNLVKNAIEAMEGRSGAVRVEARYVPDRDRVRISVSDQGVGIPPEARDKIFQPFFTTKSIGKGTGLGLPISYGIVKMHRGTIWFESESGKGTTFHLELPQSQAMHARSISNEQTNDSIRR